MKDYGYVQIIIRNFKKKKTRAFFSCPLHIVINKVVKQNLKDYKEFSNEISGYKAL